jgi:hypothetical protein
MANSSGEGPAKRKPEPLAGEVQYILVGSLIGAILLLIMLAVVTSH